jgi:hypothetical protein
MRRLAGFALCLLVLAGCGGSSATRPSSTDSTHEVQAVIASYIHALETGDLPLSCSYLSKSSQAQIVAEAKRTAPATTTCEQVMDSTTAHDRRAVQTVARKTTTKDLRITGDHATFVISRPGKTTVGNAVKEAGIWKLNE